MGKAIDDEVLLALAKKGGGGGGGTDDYEDLAHKPQVNGHTLEGNKTTSDLGIKFEDLPDAPTIPNDLADLQDDSSHRLVTDTEKATWNGKSDFSGSFSDLSNKPENSNTFQGTIAEWNQLTTAEKKAYDHASLTGAGGGEYNVDKTTGDLVPTSGMPSEYPATQVMMSDGVTSVEDALDNLNKPSGSGAANRLAFREEITEITDEMWASIANGTFDKVHVGMHYTAASGRKYWFADADYYFGKSSPEQTRHHMLVVEDEISHTAQHQTTNVTTGGATASLIYTTTLPGIQSELNADFGESHILTQSLYLTNAISNNVASGGAYIDKKAALLNICQVMGHGLGYTEGTGQYLNALLRERQLSLFQAMPETIVARDKTTQERQWYWCDDVISGSAFGLVDYYGYANYDTASKTWGVRRAFLIG